MPLSGSVARKHSAKRIDAGSLPAQTGSAVRKFYGKRSDLGSLGIFTDQIWISDDYYNGSQTVFLTNCVWNNIGNFYAGYKSATCGYQSCGACYIANIPKGVVIQHAYIYCYVTEFQDGANITCYGIDEDNTDNFQHSPLGREFTLASVDFSKTAWSDPSVGYRYSPDIASIVQEIIDRPGWSPGNTIGIILHGETSTGYLKVQPFSFSSGEFAMQLHVTYSGITGSITRNYTGGRFLSGVLSSTGVVVRKVSFQRILSGTLSFVGSVIASLTHGVQQLYESVVGVVTLGGGVVARKFTGKRPIIGSLIASGTVERYSSLKRLIVGELVTSSEDLMINGDNEAARASFNDDSTAGCSAEQSSDRAKSGIYSIKMTNTEDGSGIGWLQFRDDFPYKITLGKTYEVSCSVYLPSGQAADTVYVEGLGGVEDQVVVVTDTDSWVDVVLHVTPLYWFGFYIILADSESIPNTSYCYIDDLAIIDSVQVLSGSVVRKTYLMRQLLGELTFSGIVSYIKGIKQFLVAIGGTLSWGEGVIARKLQYLRDSSGELPEVTGTIERKTSYARRSLGTFSFSGTIARYFAGTRVVVGISNFVGVVRRKVLYYRSDSGSLDFLGTAKGVIGSLVEFMLYVWRRLT